MIELNELRSEKNKIASALKKRGLKDIDTELSKVIELDDLRKKLKSELDKILEESNIIAKDIGIRIKNGERDSLEELKKRSGELKEKSKLISEDLKSVEIDLMDMLYNIPNIPDEIVPEGNSDEDNMIVLSKELKISNKIKYKPHWDLIKDFNLIDFDIGNKITGAGFPVYVEKGAKLQRALINYFLDEANSNGYSEVQPPVLINEESGFGTGQLPDKEGQMYKIENENLYMKPTAEVPITNMYRRKIIDKETLPIKNVAYTPCFRKEAGSWGSHVRGLNRLHQFDKVEIVQIENGNNSDKALEEMCNYVESLIKSLEISYRKLLLCGGDLGVTASITYDFEVYAPGQKRWLECSSVSNFRTYQANRMNLKVRDGKNKILANTLNGSALALPRIVAAIIETHQNGKEINIPKILHKYTGFKKITL